MLDWANRSGICCFLDNNTYPGAHHVAECIAGVGVNEKFAPTGDFFGSLSSFVEQTNDYIFGHFNYDLKNRIEPDLTSEQPDFTGFPEYCLFVPKVVLLLNDDKLQIGVTSEDAGSIFQQIIQTKIVEGHNPAVQVQPRINRQQYLDAVSQIIRHIHLGDCYVINYCQEFFAYANVDPLLLYRQLSALSPTPFAAYYKLHNHYLLCASPERYMKKQGNTLISQPIKGTAARNDADAAADALNKKLLQDSLKERSENVMVVDLVRNDIGKVATAGSVVVDELFGIYSFPNVHQMISTVSGQIKNDISFGEILKATFPMGSMTGAPKRRVMELTEKYEHSSRSIYSGTVGYIAPNKDFDFNVVIRSIVCNAASQYLSYHVGSAITAHCDPAAEYDECLLKGNTLANILAGKILKQG